MKTCKPCQHWQREKYMTEARCDEVHMRVTPIEPTPGAPFSEQTCNYDHFDTDEDFGCIYYQEASDEKGD